MAVLVLSIVAERSIGSRGHALAVGPSHCDNHTVIRGATQGAATPEGARRGGPPPAWSSLLGLLRPHRAVAPAPRAPTDARGDHARPPPRILRRFSAVANAKFVDSTLG